MVARKPKRAKRQINKNREALHEDATAVLRKMGWHPLSNWFVRGSFVINVDEILQLAQLSNHVDPNAVGVLRRYIPPRRADMCYRASNRTLPQAMGPRVVALCSFLTKATENGGRQ